MEPLTKRRSSFPRRLADAACTYVARVDDGGSMTTIDSAADERREHERVAHGLVVRPAPSDKGSTMIGPIQRRPR